MPINRKRSSGARGSVFVVQGILCVAIFVSGCSTTAKNIKPPSPYDFGLLDQMAKYAQASYADDAAIHAACAPAFTDVYINVITATNNKYFLATSTVTHAQLISIAGTANLENVLLDADETKEFIPSLNISLHRGFARAAQLIYSDLKPHLLPGYHIQIIGHSLGGAEALILGMVLKSDGTPADAIITFGQPKVSDAAGNAVFKDLPLTRVVNQNDIVPELPLAPYSSIGPVLVLFPGNTYSVVDARPISAKEIAGAWTALQNHQAPPELPQHYIASYLTDLDPKVASSQDIPYPK